MSTNWPTVAEKPDRKALNGYVSHSLSASPSKSLYLMSGITYIIPSQYAIDKLQHSHYDQKCHECVQELRPLGCGGEIVVPDSGCDLLDVLGVAD